ncbi:hypothetical protein [Pedobacter sp. MW01-1-1]|uniref:hypothetical protein n=1 Tax=Pedobacter sp. MW01-1-1 TaxID=3383027 RepID=UPI003FEF0609
MKKIEQVLLLNTFLTKAKLLRGYGDMDSYYLANQLRNFEQTTNTPFKDQKIDVLIEEMASPNTWDLAKQNFINTIESLLNEIQNNYQ